MLLIFKSSARLRYARENLTALGLPPGFRMRTDYAVHWVDKAVAEGAAGLPTPALLVFADADAATFLPVRYGTLEQVLQRGSVLGLVLRTGPFVRTGDQVDANAVFREVLGKDKLPPADGRYVQPAPDGLAEKLALSQFKLKDDNGHQLWQSFQSHNKPNRRSSATMNGIGTS